MTKMQTSYCCSLLRVVWPEEASRAACFFFVDFTDQPALDYDKEENNGSSVGYVESMSSLCGIIYSTNHNNPSMLTMCRQ